MLYGKVFGIYSMQFAKGLTFQCQNKFGPRGKPNSCQLLWCSRGCRRGDGGWPQRLRRSSASNSKVAYCDAMASFHSLRCQHTFLKLGGWDHFNGEYSLCHFSIIFHILQCNVLISAFSAGPLCKL